MKFFYISAFLFLVFVLANLNMMISSYNFIDGISLFVLLLSLLILTCLCIYYMLLNLEIIKSKSLFICFIKLYVTFMFVHGIVAGALCGPIFGIVMYLFSLPFLMLSWIFNPEIVYVYSALLVNIEVFLLFLKLNLKKK